MTNIMNLNAPPPAHAPRSADRFDTELPIEVGGMPSLTRNISATGVFFETDTHQMPGSHIKFTVEVIIRGQKFKRVYSGEVTRVEQNGDKTGVAVKLDTSFFSGVEKV